MSKKTVLFNNACGYSSAAVLENGKLTDFFFEKENLGSMIGNVYKGKVVTVLNGMQAAFIDCGLERNCYISADDRPDRNKYDGNADNIPTVLNLHTGDEIMVQLVKPPVGKKGAKVTINLSFVGKSAIYMPNTEFVGVSRKITDEELRRNLIYTAGKMLKRGEGLIVRTAAPYVSRKDMLRELENMRKIYADVCSRMANAAVGELLYTDSALPARILRDYSDFNTEKIVCDEKLKEPITLRASLYSDHDSQVVVCGSEIDVFNEYGLYEQISQILSPRVELENGAYLIIEHTEALTVIDVNTGKFIGDEGLEQTVYYTNILAAREIARQVRLRNIGGIVVVDFIDMQSENHKKSLYAEFKRALSSDRAKCNVSPISEFGLIEFTRKRTGGNPLALLTEPCKHCKQTGFIKSSKMILLETRAELLNLLQKGNKTVIIDLNNDVADKFLNWTELTEDIKTRFPQARIYLIPHRTYHAENVRFRYETSPTFSLPEGYVLLY